MITSTVENYIKQIYLEQQERPTDLLPMGRLASVMNVAPGTATAMVKTLAEAGLAEYEPRGGLRLTTGGERLALHVLRRHRILELFLVEVLKLDWSEVHEEAETLEHAVSDKVLERMDQLLDHPQFDPHGDPIPTAKGKIHRLKEVPLAECAQGQRFSIVRVADQDPAFLQFVERNGLQPGTEGKVSQIDVLADAVTVQCHGRPACTLGSKAAAKIRVQTV
jgi:DtxR family transcriptional regulator, Mn-dependent transcriptional regulator